MPASPTRALPLLLVVLSPSFLLRHPGGRARRRRRTERRDTGALVGMTYVGTASSYGLDA